MSAMPRFIIAFAFLFYLGLSCMAQGNLQFNQTLVLSLGNTYTVPAGKTWKVESAVYSSPSLTFNNGASAYIDNAKVSLIPFAFYDGTTTGRSPYSTAFPMWLPAATTITPSEQTSKMFVIEFNVIP
jgi:hypothetical protein